MHKNIKFGIKISTKDFHLLPVIYNHDNLIDFIEVIIFPDFIDADLDNLNLIELPYCIHLPNSNYGIDFGNIRKQQENKIFIQKINRFKKKFKELTPFCYIVHPESGDIDLSISNIKKLKVRPIAIENMPLKSLLGGELLGFNVKSLDEFFQKISNLEFCFDINHAIKASYSLQIDHISFIKEFLKYKQPLIFHIAGGDPKIGVDEHLNLSEGAYDLSEIKDILFNYGKEIFLTFETPRNNNDGIADDLKNFKIFLES